MEDTKRLPHAIARDYIQFLFPVIPHALYQRTQDGEENADLDRVICWPPNLFALTSILLRETDAYRQTVCPPRRGKQSGLGRRVTWPPSLKILSKATGDAHGTWMAIGSITRRRNADEDRDHNMNANQEDWYRAVTFCGSEWTKYLAKNRRLASLIDPRQRKIPVKSLSSPESLEGLYAPFLRAWPLFRHQRGQALSKSRHAKEEAARSALAARGLSLLWQSLLKSLERRDERGQMPEGARGIGELLTNWRLFVVAMTLHAIADEACLGWGLHKARQRKPRKGLKRLLDFVEALLDEHGTIALTTTEWCRVLPKRHTPTVGMTLRNLSLNLAFHQSPVEVRWKQGLGFGEENGPSNDTLTRMSILLLPWPLRIDARDFRPWREQQTLKSRVGEEGWHYFSYRPFSGDPRGSVQRRHERALGAYVKGALGMAEQEAGSIDMVIFPEMSMSRRELEIVERVFGRRVKAYVAGVREKRERTDQRHDFDGNAVYCRTRAMVCRRTRANADKRGECWPSYRESSAPKGYEEGFGPRNGPEVQYKHHRWCLTRPQITQYQLGGVLSPRFDWWEGIALDERAVRFINIGGELTLCPLICEDLARQEPIGDLIRATGPSLVIAVLLDGPQLRERWSARYASVLADDPGCAVITLTALGMVERCQSRQAVQSRAIALWSDVEGPPREIELARDAHAVLLSVAVEDRFETSADGRRDGIATNTAILGGIHQIRIPRWPGPVI